jgi:hypothetical protein
MHWSLGGYGLIQRFNLAEAQLELSLNKFWR